MAKYHDSVPRVTSAERLPLAGGRFTRTAADAGQATRLRRQAELLATVQVPGVVRLEGLEGPPDEPVLVTDRIDGPDLARAPALTVEEVAGVVAELARTLSDLHDIGVVHGAVVAEHVLLAPDGRPVLCGFGYGARAGEVPVAEAPLPEAAADPARTPGEPLWPASDVLALGALLDDLLAEATPAASGAAYAEALRAIARRTAVGEPDLRPSARAVAEAVTHAVPTARLPGTSAERSESGSDALRALRGVPGLGGRGGSHRLPLGRRTGVRLVPVALAVVVAGGFIARGLLGGSPEPEPQPAEPQPRSEARAAASASLTTRPPDTAPLTTRALLPSTRPLLREGCPPLSGQLAADVDGDGCPESLRWEAGIVEGGNRRWAVGQPGDLALTGDWTCTGSATLAVLRPATGQVFVFEGWAATGREVTGAQAATVAGAFALRAAELDGDSCPDLLVERTGGPPTTVPLPRGRR